MLAYEKVYRLVGGKLVRNTENKIRYTDESGVKRTITNPTLKDFAKVGLYPVVRGDIPTFDEATQELKEKIMLKDNCYNVEYIVVKKEISEE